MRIGYACLVVGLPDLGMKTCRQENATEERLKELIRSNLKVLEDIIDYNIRNQISLFRISSDLIPFGSSPINQLHWWDFFSHEFRIIGEKIRNSSMRVSMHPGQYTVLNSPNSEVVSRAILDLAYHNLVLDSLGLGAEHKIILHLGGVYKDRQEALNRFKKEAGSLDQGILKRLVLENDDRSYSIDQVLEVGNEMGLPVVFDNLHHQLHPPNREREEREWIRLAAKTWKAGDGPQKIHYSQQAEGKRLGAHSERIDLDKFLEFCHGMGDLRLDIMLEVKDKNLSAVKCMNGLSPVPAIKNLELEWSRYKYNILEASPPSYQRIRELLKDKKRYPVKEFYQLLDQGLQEKVRPGNSVNALMHVWGYFKDQASEKEKKKFFDLLKKVETERNSSAMLKRYLHQLSIAYDQSYLKDSYFFFL